MNFLKLAKKFQRDENGAVTVDWVVLTAAVVGLGVAVLTVVSGGTKEMAAGINDALDAEEIISKVESAGGGGGGGTPPAE